MNIHLSFSKHCWQYPILVTLHEKARSSRPGVFCKKGVFENFANQRCFPVNFAKFSRTPFFKEHLFSKNTFFQRTPAAAASEKLKAEAVVRRYSVKMMFLKILLNSQINTCVSGSLFYSFRKATLLK